MLDTPVPPGSNHVTAAATEVATLAGGCFWCLEAVYLEVDGVLKVESGYSNGHVKNPSYEQVCEGDTGHAEVVRLTYDPKRISFRDLLEIFFVIHDPSTLNRQGNDVGTQYRSGIYTHDDEQVRIAKEVIAELAANGIKATTEVLPEQDYSPAEAYPSATSSSIPTRATAPSSSRRRWRSSGRTSRPDGAWPSPGARPPEAGLRPSGADAGGVLGLTSQKFLLKPTNTVRRGPYCGAPTPMPEPSRNS